MLCEDVEKVTATHTCIEDLLLVSADLLVRMITIMHVDPGKFCIPLDYSLQSPLLNNQIREKNVVSIVTRNTLSQYYKNTLSVKLVYKYVV